MIYIFIALVLLGFVLKKFKIMNVLVIAYLAYLVSVSIFIPDFQNYEYIYEHINPSQTFGMGMGWYWLNNLGRGLNLTYAQFRTILLLISLTLISLAIYYFLGTSPNMLWSLYLLYPAFLDMVQIRFFFAMSISFFALIFLEKQKKWSILIFLLLIFIAMKIHSSNAFYFLFIGIPLIRKHEKLMIIMISALTLLLIPFRGPLENIVSVFASERQTYYFTTNASWIVILLFDVLIIVFCLITYKINNIIETASDFDLKEKRLGYLCSGINLVMLFLVPLSWVSSEFLRLQRISWIFMYMALYILYKHNRYINILNIRVNSKLLSIMLAVFGYSVLIMGISPLAFTSFFE